MDSLAAPASAALARLPLQIFCSRKAKHSECDLERVHMLAHVEASVIAEAFLHRYKMLP
jgi:hypothetical protein